MLLFAWLLESESLYITHAAAEHHVDLPTLAPQTDSEDNHLTEQPPTTTNENSQPRTTNSSDVDDEGDNQDQYTKN